MSLGQQKRSFLRNTDNFLAFFVTFEWGRILEKAVDKQKVKCNAKLCSNYFSANVSVLVVVFRRQFLKNRPFQAKLLGFLNLPVKYNS